MCQQIIMQRVLKIDTNYHYHSIFMQAYQNLCFDQIIILKYNNNPNKVKNS